MPTILFKSITEQEAVVLAYSLCLVTHTSSQCSEMNMKNTIRPAEKLKVAEGVKSARGRKSSARRVIKT